MNDHIRNYISEFVRLFILVLVLYFLNNFISWLPFISAITTFRDISLSAIISLIISLVALFMIIEFSLRTKELVDNILGLIPKAGKLYSFIIYLCLCLFVYSSFYNIVFAFTGEDWIWAYQSVFIAITLFIAAKIALIVYENSAQMSKNFVDLISKFHKTSGWFIFNKWKI